MANIVTNKKTGVEYQMTDEEVAKIKANPLLSNAYKFTQKADVPEEVQQLRVKRGRPRGSVKKPSE